MNPHTLDQLRRFRRMKRAWWSFLILLFAYVVSLGSELIANNEPLFIWYEGKAYFPVFRFYPETVFTGSGRNTRPNYKAIKASVAFGEDSGNIMLLPPIPYGPTEIIDADTIDVANEVEVQISPVRHTGNVNITPSNRVERGMAAGFFFGVEDDQVCQLDFEDYYPIEGRLKQALAARFANQSAPRYEQEIHGKKGRSVVVTMPAFRPRMAPPTTIRLTLREPDGEGKQVDRLFFQKDLILQRGHSALWEKASAEEKSEILHWVKLRYSVPIEPQVMTLAGEKRQVSFLKTDVRWPFRPSKGHWLGIDGAGRDVLTRILYGFRISMSFAILLVLFSMATGIVLGAMQGYFGGLLDITGQRLIEIWSALPFLYVMILLGSVYGRSFLLLLIVYAVFNWIGISYYMRAEFLRLRKLQFTEAARSLGVPTWRILFRHIFPNALVPVITFFPFSLVGAIGSLAALDYLGFGMPPPTASWGELLNQAQEYTWAWWLVLYPSLALFLVMLLGVFVGEGVRNAFDPRSYNKVV